MGLKTPLKLVRKDNGVCYMGQCEHEWYEIQDREGNPIISNFEYEHTDNYLEMKEIVKRVNEYEDLQKENDSLIEEIINLRNDLDNQIALNRELVKGLKDLFEVAKQGFDEESYWGDFEELIKRAEEVE